MSSPVPRFTVSPTSAFTVVEGPSRSPITRTDSGSNLIREFFKSEEEKQSYLMAQKGFDFIRLQGSKSKERDHSPPSAPYLIANNEKPLDTLVRNDGTNDLLVKAKEFVKVKSYQEDKVNNFEVPQYSRVYEEVPEWKQNYFHDRVAPPRKRLKQDETYHERESQI